MLKKVRKWVFSGIFYAAIFALTVWYLFHDENPAEVLQYVTDAQTPWVLAAIASVILFILGESAAIYYLLHSTGVKSKFHHCCLFSFIGFFFNAITPSASGGQPMQIMYMRQDGIPVAQSSIVLVVKTIANKAVLVLTGLAIAILHPGRILECLAGVMPFIYLGMTLNVAAICLLLAAVFLPDLLERLANGVLQLIQKIHPFRNPQRVTGRVNRALSQYRGTSVFLRKNPGILLNVFLITFVQRFCMFSIAWFSYRAFGLVGEKAINIVVLYAMISIAADMLPLPGGMGISETLFTVIFSPIFGADFVLPGMVLCRGISYYTQLILSAVMTVAAHISFRRKPAELP